MREESKLVMNVKKMLPDFYTEDDADAWLYTGNAAIRNARPIDLIEAGRLREVVAIIEQLKA